jgi:NADH dehydrogenase FAD-containing subunit
MGVNMLTQTKVDRIDRDTVVLNRNGERQRVRADTVVVATGSKANRELAEKLEGVITEVHVIGDCQEPRRIFEAIHEGFVAGNRI